SPTLSHSSPAVVAVADHVLRDVGKLVGTGGIHAFHVLVEPLQQQAYGGRRSAVLAGAGNGLGHRIHVRAREDRELGGDVVLELLVQQRLAALEDVVIGADDEG